MLSRREVLLASAVFALPFTASAVDRFAGANERYRRWLAQLRIDLESIFARGLSEEEFTEALMEKFFAKSVVPNSRASGTLRAWLAEDAKQGADKRRRRRIPSFGSLAIELFGHCVPAGYGGLFPEPSGSAFSSNRAEVWYMHIDGGDMLQPYFDDGPISPRINFRVTESCNAKRSRSYCSKLAAQHCVLLE